MISYEQAGQVLDEAVDTLPEEIFRDLNGGVNLIRRSRTDEHGLLIMGTYNVNQMGRYIEIYYGSFQIKYPTAPPEKCRDELIRTLKHELTHHIESLAMDRSLEKWDEQHVAELLSGLYDDEFEPLIVDSILFVDSDGSGLAEMAKAMFLVVAASNYMDDVSAGCASLNPGALSIKAARAAVRCEVSLSANSAPSTISRELCESYDAVLCMTGAISNELAARWPDLSDKIMCLGDNDFSTPRIDTQGSWNRLADAMLTEINTLVAELMGADLDD